MNFFKCLKSRRKWTTNLNKSYRLFSQTCTPLKYGEYSVIKDRQILPENIEKPSYFLSGLVEKVLSTYPKTEREIKHRYEKMEDAATMALMMRDAAEKIIEEGTTPQFLHEALIEFAEDFNFYPAALYYKNFPKAVSVSVNNIACHGIPDVRPFKKGDIVSVDTMSFVNNHFGDCCGTFIVGKGSEKARHLVSVAKECTDEAIKICGPGVPFKEIGRVISKIAKRENLTVIKEYSGHGISRNLHEEPIIFHFENNFEGVMEEGMTFTIEPILTTGNGETFVWEDKWTVATKDEEPCAQFEETIAITKKGNDILTRFPEREI